MGNATHHKALLTIMAIALCAVAFSCTRSNDEGGKVRTNLPLEKLHDGDLLFRCGVSAQSQVVMSLDSAESQVYTHIGIAFKDGETWRVVHAVPGESNDGVDRVKIDAVDTFFMTSRAVHGAAMRPINCNANAAHTAALKAREMALRGIEFDNRYDWNDSTRLYCTELVQKAYSVVGIDLCSGRSTHLSLPFYKGDVVLPGDIARNDSLRTVFSF